MALFTKLLFITYVFAMVFEPPLVSSQMAPVFRVIIPLKVIVLLVVTVDPKLILPDIVVAPRIVMFRLMNMIPPVLIVKDPKV